LGKVGGILEKHTGEDARKPGIETNIYEENGYRDREEYLKCLAEEYGILPGDVGVIADMLGPDEDFDGLVSMLEDTEYEWG
jgi:hypothetical protein